MASFLLPSTFPKRLISYALARLELLETDTLDLEHLDITWGSKSVFEFRDVGLRMKKIVHLLQLPPNFDLTKARVLLLRLTIPVDFINSPIIVEVEGIEGHMRILSGTDDGTSRPVSSRGSERTRNRPDDRQSKLRSGAFMGSRGEGYGMEDDESDSSLPTAVDLATSFLEMEPAEEKAELEAAISSQSQILGASVALSDDGDNDSEVGTGAALSLPTWIANLLKGIVDRLQVRIQNISFTVDVNVPPDNVARGDIPTQSDLVTLQLKIEDIDIEGVTLGRTEGPSDDTSNFERKSGKRLINLRNIRGAIISEASLFASLARSSGLSSPSTTHSNITSISRSHTRSKTTSRTKDGGIITSSMSLSDSQPTLPISPRHSSQASLAYSGRDTLSNSNIVSEGSRFDDALEDDGDDPHAADASVVGSSVFGNSAYLDQVTDSRFLDDGDEDEDTLPFSISHHEQSSTSKIRSPLSTPRASLHLTQSSHQPRSHVSDHTSSAIVSGGETRSIQLPVGSRSSLSEPVVPQSHPQTSSDRFGEGSGSVSNPRRFLSHPESSSKSDDSEFNSKASTPMGEDDLAQSKIFSHEDAESMYMSALSQGSAFAKMPGAWDASSNEGSDRGLHQSVLKATESIQQEPLYGTQKSNQTGVHNMESLPENMEASARSVSDHTENSNVHTGSSSIPSAQPAPSVPQQTDNSSTMSGASFDVFSKVSKPLFHLDKFGVYLPSSTISSPHIQEDHSRSMLFASTFDGSIDATSSISANVPGAFSAYAARPRENRSAADKSSARSTQSAFEEEVKALEIVMGNLKIHFDVSVARLIAKLFSIVSEVIKGTRTTSEASGGSDGQRALTVQLTAEKISAQFLERLPAVAANMDQDLNPQDWVKAPVADVLLRAKLKGLSVKTNVSQASTVTAISLRKFRFGYAKEDIISFNAELLMRASVRDLAPEAGVDLIIDVSQTPSINRVKISTLPVHISIDLQRLDETFSWFGGLSSVLNMGSSMASTATMTAGNANKSPGKLRSVRFDAPIKPEDTSVASQNKVDVRVGGIFLNLIGKDCSVTADTSPLKMVSREEGLGLSVDKIKISGPHLNRSNDEPPISLEIIGTRIEYLTTPKDVDLDRLLSLITPSKAKYDQDDDILIDTLLRQRRQGGLVRITMDDFKANIHHLEQLSYLPELGEEISRLSTVAKYLPEDDRPGLLSLILVRKVNVWVDVNGSVGSLRALATDLEVAQITLPALVALSVTTVTLHRNSNEELIGSATSIELHDPKSRSPAVMARVIGDEMEPVVKIRLWNIKVEYRVTMAMAILGLSDGATTEDMATSIALSVATLTDRTPSDNRASKGGTKVSHVKPSETKAMKVSVVIRDCILGLNPMGLPSKILFVLTESHISVTLPKDNTARMEGDLNKGTILIIDDVVNAVKPYSRQTKRQSFDGGSTQVADLCSTGYVAIGYISSAKAIIQVSGTDDEINRHLDVELRDDLLVLESCADSTQTLVATLSALAPPMPANQETKYRTKVIPVEDLLASLSGNAFGTAEGNYNFDEDFGPDLTSMAEESGTEDVGGLSFDSQYYQAPAENIKHGSDSILATSGEGSVFFDQFMSHDTNDGVLLEKFQERQEFHDVEALDFQEDHFGTGSILEGTAHRWNSAKNTYDRSNERKVRTSPLKVCIRDVHIIWNLFDGYDWQHTRDAIAKAVQDVESKAIEKKARYDRRTTFELDVDDEETVIGDFLFNSIYIGIPSNREPRELAMAINQDLNDDITETESVTTTTLSASPSRQDSGPRVKGKKLRLQRSKNHKITFELKGVNVDFVAFPPDSGETQGTLDIRVHDLEIFDHVPTSTWKKFATYMHDAGERETGASQVHIEILTVKPIPELGASEMVLKVTVLPLRLHVDQDALDFITRFFEFKDDSAPVSTSKSDPPFLQRVEVNSVQVKLDFKPKRVDYAGLRSGHTTEFMNFIVLDEADMVLRHTIIYGISGFDRLGKTLNDIWMPDIKRNQLPGILAGLAPVRSLANVGGGVRDLVVVPMREYKKDGRVVRSISKGAAAFARTTGTELIKFGAKLAVGTQTVLQGAEEFLTKPQERLDRGWEDDDLDEEEKKQISLYADQPVGVIQGLRGAYSSLERDLIMARDAIIAVPGEVMESTTAKGAAKAVLRRAPTVILRPVIGASKAISQTLMGATNSLDPQNLRRIDDKYKKY